VFGKLKAVFTTEPVLAILDINREMRVEADALDYATGGVLLTKCEDGKWRPVAFISKSLNATERKYKIHDKEMLAVIRCLRSMEILFGEGKAGIQNLDGPQKSPVLYDKSKVKPKTSKIGLIPIMF